MVSCPLYHTTNVVGVRYYTVWYNGHVISMVFRPGPFKEPKKGEVQGF